MIKTRSRTISEMDSSPVYRVGRDGMFLQQRSDTRGMFCDPYCLAHHTADLFCSGVYQGAVPNFSHNPQRRAVQHSPKTIDELASALLDDSTSEQQALTTESAHSSVAEQGTLIAGYLPDETSPQHTHAMMQANMAAFAKNRQITSPPTHMPSRTLRSKASVRQSNGYVTRGRVAQGGGSLRHQGSVRRQLTTTSPELPDTSATRLALSNTKDVLGLAKQMRAQELRDFSALNLSEEAPRKVDRRSMAGVLNERPNNVATVRRSKTTRSSRKTGLSKQKSVLKKMTDAITDRLHLTNKSAITEDPAADSGDSEMNEFLMDVIASRPTQERKPSIRNRVVKRGNPDRLTEPQQIIGVYSEGRSPRRSKSLTQDPFSDPEEAIRVPTEFVNRLKASSVSRPSFSTMGGSESDSLLRGSLGSVLHLTPKASSSPRVQILWAQDEDFNNPLQSRALMPTSGNAVAAGASLVSDTPTEQSFEDKEEVIDPDRLAPMHELTYMYPTGGPVVKLARRATNRKKHPSPSKDDLAILETQLRAEYSAALSRKTRKIRVIQEGELGMTKKHPSPRKADIQSLGRQFRQLYPEVLERSIAEKSSESEKIEEIEKQFRQLFPDVLEHSVAKKSNDSGKMEKIENKARVEPREKNEVKEEMDEMDELAADCTSSSLVKPAISRRQVLAVTGFPRLEPSREGRHRTFSIRLGCHSPATLPDCACPGSSRASMETDCPLHGAATEINELQWNDSAYQIVPRHVC
jgi:hypothetical protein